jgi:hypothetical protein
MSKVYLTSDAPTAAVTLYTDSKQTQFGLKPDDVASEYSGGVRFTVSFQVCNDATGRYIVVPEECEGAIANITRP